MASAARSTRRERSSPVSPSNSGCCSRLVSRTFISSSVTSLSASIAPSIASMMKRRGSSEVMSPLNILRRKLMVSPSGLAQVREVSVWHVVELELAAAADAAQRGRRHVAVVDEDRVVLDQAQLVALAGRAVVRRLDGHH